MKQSQVRTSLSVDDFVKALVGEDDDDLQQLNGHNIKSTILFVEAARRRLEALAIKQRPQYKKT